MLGYCLDSLFGNFGGNAFIRECEKAPQLPNSRTKEVSGNNRHLYNQSRYAVWDSAGMSAGPRPYKPKHSVVSLFDWLIRHIIWGL